jgi:magnesium chelatase family protein
VPYRELRDRREGEGSERMREQVVAARERQRERFAHSRIRTNASMSNRHITRHCQLDADGEALLEQAMAQHAFSARSYTRILKVARTIADLAGADRVRLEHLSEAIQYRTTERHFWK